MPTSVTIYKTEDFIRGTKKGKVDVDRTIKAIQGLAQIAQRHANRNILIDVRGRKGWHSPADLMRVALEFIRHRSVFRNKTALLIPDREMDIAEAGYFQAYMDYQGLEFETFVDFEDAINWLMTIRDHDTDD